MFSDQSFEAPVIHVVSESPRLEMLQARLRQAGIRPVPVRGNYLPPDSAPAFIDLLTRDFAFEPGDNRLFVTIGKDAKAPSKSEIHLTDVTQISTLPARLAIRQRENQRQREIQLRARTSEKFGSHAAVAPTRRISRALWLGRDAPFLNAIKASLETQNISLVAAISRLTAEDYLVSGGFQSVVLCPASPDDEAAKFLATISQLQLTHKPQVILLLRPDLAPQLNKEHVINADQIVDLSADIDMVASQLEAMCSQPEHINEPSYGLTAAAQDPATGLVSREYLESHVEAQMAQADRLASSLSLIAIEIDDNTDIRAMADAIKALLRDTDLAARLDNKHICVTLPNTQYRGAVILTRRIEEVLKRRTNWRVIERRQFHTLKTLLGGLTAKTTISARKTA